MTIRARRTAVATAATAPLAWALAGALAAALVPAAARAGTAALDALALVSTAEPAAPATLALVGEPPGDEPDGTSERASADDGPADGEPVDATGANDVALLELDSPALSLRLALEPHELVAGVDGRPDAAASAAWEATFGAPAPTAYRGDVPGSDGSWARLLEADGAWSGHVAVDGTLWRVDPVRGPAPDGATRGATDADGPVVGHAVRRLAGVDPSPGASVDGHDGAPVLRIGVVVDSRFDARHGGRGLERALAIVNGVDGLFRATLGIGLAIDAVRVHADPATDPLVAGGDTVESMLETFRLVRDADPELPADLALVHLFTGLEDARGAFGLGYVDAACRGDGWATALSTPFAFDMLLAAHEMAHVVGATHDDDPSCAGLADETDLMRSTLSGRTRATFSACSVAAVRRTLESGCLVGGRVAAPR